MRALILVDLQNDFCPGGHLAVPDGDAVIQIANSEIPKFDLVVATQDWHPADHLSFAANHGKQPGETVELKGVPQVLWPVHCVQNKKGADFHPELRKKKIHKIFRKGMDREVDSYSGFYDNRLANPTGLAAYLKEQGVECVAVMGLATDYCVMHTALDSLRSGFETFVLTDGCRGVELKPGDICGAYRRMLKNGIKLLPRWLD